MKRKENDVCTDGQSVNVMYMFKRCRRQGLKRKDSGTEKCVVKITV